MELTRLIQTCSEPAAYPYPLERVEVRQTHISVVFLAGPYAYKIKKPVNLGFLDFSTLEKRRHFCEQEVRLNRRLAAKVYLGVVPLTRTGKEVRVEGRGEVIEWAVKMERLPEEATLRELLRRAEVDSALVEALARRIASFHSEAEAGAHVAAFGRFDVVARNARENFTQAGPQVGSTLSRAVMARLEALTEAALARLRPLIEGRANRGIARDMHGDLHLDHVYVFPQQERQCPDAPTLPSPSLAQGRGQTISESLATGFVIVDCIEFNERFRFADPVADMAFLVMDLAFHDRRDLARTFAEAYFRASADEEGRALLPFYTAYRAAVRAKVEGFKLAEKEIPEAERAVALGKARAHWLLALAELEEPAWKQQGVEHLLRHPHGLQARPCLVLVGGLPGTGKSVLAQGLAERANFSVIRSDLVRKELAGLSGLDRATAAFGQGIYNAEWTKRTYAACLHRAEQLLFEGRRVIVDATFQEESWRQMFLEAASRWGVQGIFFWCQADPETVRGRLEQRQGDASDADWSVYTEMARRWEQPGPGTRQALRVIPTAGNREGPVTAQMTRALLHALDVLRELQLQE